MISPRGVVVAEGLGFALTVVLFGARCMVHMQMHMKALLFTISIMIPSLISLRPLLRKIHKWTSTDESHTSFSHGNLTGVTSGKRKTGHGSILLKGSHAVYSNPHVRNIYGSEVELTEHEPSKIYKTEEISVTSTRDPQQDDEDKSSR